MSYGGVFEYSFSYDAPNAAPNHADDELYVANHDVIMQVPVLSHPVLDLQLN